MLLCVSEKPTESVNYLVLVLPVIITVVANIFFYLFIKSRVDKRMEQAKIAYSGVFKEKIDIYRDILDKTYKIKLLVHRYNYLGNDEMGREFGIQVEDYINFYLKNQPFISDEMLDKLKKLREEFQFIYENSYMYYELSDKVENPTELFVKLQEARNRLKKDSPFEEIENSLIKEMKDDFFPKTTK